MSSHYVIDREGKIVRFVPEERAAYHAGIGSLPGFPELDDNLNDHSVGIELLAMGSREEMAGYITGEAYDSLAPGIPGYTEAQYASLNALIREIAARAPGNPAGPAACGRTRRIRSRPQAGSGRTVRLVPAGV